MTADRYSDFAERYDLFFGRFGEYSPDESGFFEMLFKRHQVKNVLDCACGTGRHLPLFYRLGCQVEASDCSPAMLRKAAQNLETAGLDIPLSRLDYRELGANFQKRFDAVVCLSSAIDEMLDEAEVLKAFNSMRSVLVSNGILVLSQGTSDCQWKARPRFIPAVNNPDFTRVFVIDYLEQGAVYNVLDLYHTQSKTDFKAWSMYFKKIFLHDDMERLLKAAGFQTINIFGNYDGSKYSKLSSPRLIVVATAGV